MVYKRKPKVRAGYTGKLAEPMPDFDAETAAFYTLTAPYPATLKDAVKESPKKFERIAKKLQAAAYNERLDLLFAHYGIDPTKPNAWRDLTVALAKRYVPGFQPPRAKSAGAPKKWDDFRYLKLRADVVVLRRQGLSVDAAIQTLISRGGPYRLQKAGSLKARFKEALTRSTPRELFKLLSPHSPSNPLSLLS